MRKLFGGILIAVGILIAGASGICSLGVIVSGLSGGGGREFGGLLGMLPLVALVGGVPFGVGVILILWARKLLRDDD